MREISKNIEPGKIRRHDVKFKGAEKSEPSTDSMSEKEINDLSNSTEVLGRSQVGKVDNLQTDVAFGMANKDAIESADKFFDMTYNQLVEENNPCAYAEACARTKIYVDEFHS